MAPLYLRPAQVGAYLKEKYGFGSKKALDVLAVKGGGPDSTRPPALESTPRQRLTNSRCRRSARRKAPQRRMSDRNRRRAIQMWKRHGEIMREKGFRVEVA